MIKPQFKATVAFRIQNGLEDLTRDITANTRQGIFDNVEFFIEDQITGPSVACSYFKLNSAGAYKKISGWRK